MTFSVDHHHFELLTYHRYVDICKWNLTLLLKHLYGSQEKNKIVFNLIILIGAVPSEVNLYLGRFFCWAQDYRYNKTCFITKLAFFLNKKRKFISNTIAKSTFVTIRQKYNKRNM